MPTDRRKFLQLLSAGALSAEFPESIARALQIPADSATGTIEDVQHVVIMMQENRSFDHYFGTLAGVRGFGDPRPATLRSGKPVWYQPNGDHHVLPFHPGAPNLGMQFLQDLAHDWKSTQAAWNGGNYDGWVPNKGTTTMAHLVRSDIPFHFALADAFTICDAYHCSLFGPTDPNRFYMWSGCVGNDGHGGGPVVDNAEAGYSWSTYPERLEAAGISWKIYQDQGLGLTAAGKWGSTDDPYIGNYGDNSLLYFHQYQNAPAGSPLANAAKTGTDISQGGTPFDVLKADIAEGKLPQVSWIVAPEAYSEHPNWPANYGAWYVSQILDLLTANPDVWSKTAFFLTYDENDGFFDHVVPPTPPQTRGEGLSTVNTANEIFKGNEKYAPGPYGLGVRVPLLVISPWSKGGWVSSELFDHTSLIRFLEQRFCRTNPGLMEGNISTWRRAVCGDLTSAFNFRSPNAKEAQLPSTKAYLPPDNAKHPDYVPAPPVDQAMPKQERGTRPARPVPYELHVHAKTIHPNGAIELWFKNEGKRAAVFQVRSGTGHGGPWTYTVGPKAELSDVLTAAASGQDQYDLAVYGPNGFLRVFKGTSTGAVHLRAVPTYDKSNNGITLDVTNKSELPMELAIFDGYAHATVTHSLRPSENIAQHWPLKTTGGWYDFSLSVKSDKAFGQRLAGHVETGRESLTDPAIGA